MFTSKFRYLFIIILAFYSYLNIRMVEALEYYKIDVPHPYILTLLLIVVAGIWEGNRLSEGILKTVKSKFENIYHWLIFTFTASIIVTTIVTGIPSLVLGFVILKYDVGTAALPLKLVFAFAFRVNLFLNVLNIIFFFVKRYKETQLQAEVFKKVSLQAELQAIRNQINPHFLFNNLNVLSTLVYKNPDMATEFINELSKVFRYVLKNHEKDLVELNTEIEFTKSYLYTLQMRFGRSLGVDINLSPETLKYSIVPVSLQMLIENAIKHNIVSKTKPLFIEIFEQDTFLVVRNNLQPKKEAQDSTQIGLKNIRKRYEFLTDKEVEIINNTDCFVVKVPLLKIS